MAKEAKAQRPYQVEGAAPQVRRATSRDSGLDYSPESDIPGPDHIGKFAGAGFVNGFKLALVCETWTLYLACNEAERGASQATINVRAFVQETEAISWLTGS